MLRKEFEKEFWSLFHHSTIPLFQLKITLRLY